MTIPERLERVWSKWPESRPKCGVFELRFRTFGACWWNPATLSPQATLDDIAALALAFDAMVEAVARPGSWVRLRDEGSEWSCRTGSTTDPTYGPTRLAALLSAVEKMLGLT